MHDIIEQLEAKRALLLVVFVVADGRPLDAVVIEELARLPRVFAGNQVGLFKNADGAVGHVFQIADGSGHDV